MSIVGSKLLEGLSMVKLTEPTLIVKMKKREGAAAPIPVIEGVRLLSQRAFIQNIVNHGHSYFDRSSLEYAMIHLAETLIDELRRGNSVKWEGLGIFSPTFREGRLNINFRPSKEAQRELRKAAVKIKRCPMEYEECDPP